MLSCMQDPVGPGQLMVFVLYTCPWPQCDRHGGKFYVPYKQRCLMAAPCSTQTYETSSLHPVID